jgi:amino acid transporter
MQILEIAQGEHPGIVRRNTEYQPARSWRTWLIGRPLATAEAPNQAINKIVGLAVFSSDAMSSVAYAPQELMLILALAGTGALHLAVPLALAIVGLLAILTLSYEQTIHAYPGGGGAYIVARDNLGELPAQVAGAALLTDYILTVAVSISSGVAQIVSAFPQIYAYRVEISVAMVLLVMVINLRGVKESGVVFAVPTYFFLLMAFLTVGIGLFRYLTGALPPVSNPPVLELAHGPQTLTLFLVLRAFASGTTALTGVEAISNGITAFKEPRSHNAGRTLLTMSVILGSLMLAITFLAHQVGAVPTDIGETVISQVARTALGSDGLLYLATIASTTLILLMAANTAFADFPRLAALQAGDGFLPRQLTFKGSRLVFSRGIIVLALIASALIVAFRASVASLIPLYAIGVFLSFTLSQSGMARRWWRVGHLKPDEEVKDPGSTLRYDTGWRTKLVINGLGAVTTAIVMFVFATTKFRDGAWIIVVLIPVLVFIFFSIHHHYRSLAQRLSLDDYQPDLPPRHHRVIMPIGGVHQATLLALRYALLLGPDLTAVHVSIDSQETEKVRRKWQMYGEGVRLEVLESPYRTLLEPLLAYIEEIYAARQPGDKITIIVPQFVSRHWWTNLLHTHTATWLRMALLFKPEIVITDVPYLVN